MDCCHLNLEDLTFSTRGVEIKEAREKAFFATTPYGLAILRYKEVGQLLRDRRLRQGSHAWPDKNNLTGSFGKFWKRSIIGQEGEYHRKLRNVLVPALSQGYINSLIPEFEALAMNLCAKLRRKKSCEFMTEFAKPYAGQAMSLLLGLEGSQWEMISQDASDLGLAMGVDCKANEVVFDKAYERLAKLSNDLIEKAQSGRDKTSFVAKLLEQANNFEGFTNLELSDLIVISIFGGVDTTRSQLGLGLLTFIKYPKEWIKLEKDGSLAENAFHELIRERPTTTWVTREAVMDFEFSGVEIKRGTTLHLLVHSSARDPVIDDQQRFNISKRRKKHFGFGGGAHHCVGHFMAKTDSIIALNALVKTIKDISLNGKVVLLPDSGNTSPLRLPIKYQINGPVKYN